MSLCYEEQWHQKSYTVAFLAKGHSSVVTSVTDVASMCPQGAHFYSFSHAGNTFSKAWKEKFTVVYRQLLRKFRAFSNQNRRILHVPDKSVIPLRRWREQHDLCYVLAVNRLILINRDLMLPTSSLLFITRPEDRQVLPEEFEEGWFGQPKYSTNVCVNSRFYRFRLKK